MGSEGRFEQTVSTDQDNGIIFADDGARHADDIRAALLPFARAVNDTLDVCGYPLCKGGVMAGNPQWCLSLPEWRRKFSDWMERPMPEALLNASIFFDFRPLYGDESLAEELREWLTRAAPANPLFLRHMAENALGCAPPLGRVRHFVLDKNHKEFPRTIDLKKHGSRPFVDAARVFALAHGVPHTNTAQRLRHAGGHINLGGDSIEAMIEGFYFIHRVRLRAQMHPRTPAGANRVDPYALNDMDRQALREAFRQARKLQSALARNCELSLSAERI
jgi:CBS domain-containing protein